MRNCAGRSPPTATLPSSIAPIPCAIWTRGTTRSRCSRRRSCTWRRRIACTCGDGSQPEPRPAPPTLRHPDPRRLHRREQHALQRGELDPRPPPSLPCLRPYRLDRRALRTGSAGYRHGAGLLPPARRQPRLRRRRRLQPHHRRLDRRGTSRTIGCSAGFGNFFR